MRVTIGGAATVTVLLAFAIGIVWALLPRPIPVESAAVTKGTFVATVDEDGKTRIRERYVVVAPLAGRLTRIRLKAGDRIGADEAIATICRLLRPFLIRAAGAGEEKLGVAEARWSGPKPYRASAGANRSSTERTSTYPCIGRARCDDSTGA
jgi:HlyD family secretion protein